MLEFFIYFIGMIVVWIVGIFFMKYLPAVVNNDDVALFSMLTFAISLLSWITVSILSIIGVVFFIPKLVSILKIDKFILKNK